MTKRKIPTVRIARPSGRPIQLRYICPIENRRIRISTKTRDEAEAERQKKELEARLLLGIEAKPRKLTNGPQMLWADFRESYTELKVSTFRNVETMTSTDIRIDICESIVKPRTLREMASEDTLALLQAKLLAGGRSAHTVKSYMRTLIAALNWAYRPMRWIPERIAFKLLDVDEPDKGRPITTEEFERMLASCDKVCKVDPESWKYLLRGSWESGLRLNEAMHLSWDFDGTITPVWPKHGHPYLLIPAAMQKSRKRSELPMTPDFVSVLHETPLGGRTGWVFSPASRRASHTARLSKPQVGRIIGDIGNAANVVVNAKGKTATAHDLRRSFGQRMADAGIPPRDLQAIMRHSDFATTEIYYLRDRVQDQAERIAMYLNRKNSMDLSRENEQITP